MSTASPQAPVVVTGGAGAVGSSLVRALAARGHEVRVIDNLSSGRREHLPRLPRVVLIDADLREPERFADQFRGAVAVWHLAANPDIRLGTAEPRIDLENGTIATFNVLEAARRHDVRSVAYSSSSVVYGSARVFPTPEEYGPLLPESMYAAGKLAAEGLVSGYAHSYGFRTCIYRFANIIGPAMTHGILPDFFAKLRRDPSRLEVLGDGKQAKSYLRTEECIEGMLVGFDQASEPVNLFNLGNTDRISVRTIAEKVVAAHGGTARIEFTGGSRGWVGDVPAQLLSIERIGRLGWTPRLNSAATIDKTIAEMQAAERAAGQPATLR